MATITGLSAERMRQIEAASIVDGRIDESGHLILTRYDETEIDAGDALVAVPESSVIQFVTGFTEVTPAANYPDGVSLQWIDGASNASTWPTFSGKWGHITTVNFRSSESNNDTSQVWTRLGGSGLEPEKWFRIGSTSGWTVWRRVVTKKEFDDRMAPTTSKSVSDPPSTYPSGLSMTTMDGTTGPVWPSIPTTQFGTLITANGGDLRSFQLMQVEDGYLHIRRYRSDLGGWRAFTKVFTEQRLSPIDVNQATTPFISGRYPWGLSYLYLSDAQSSAGGWSWGAKYGMVTTYRYSDDFIVQTWQKHAGGTTLTELWQRTANATQGWSPWRVIVSDQVDDTGWVSLTPATGFVSSPTSAQHQAAVRRIGKLVRFRGILTGTINVGVTAAVANMPSNPNIPFPLKATNFCFVGNTAGNVGWSNVTETGSITAHFKTPYASGTTTIDLNALSYVVD